MCTYIYLPICFCLILEKMDIISDIYPSSSATILLLKSIWSFVTLDSLSKLLEFGLYFADVTSDILLALDLNSNCHFHYFYASITIMIISYLTTVQYLIRRNLSSGWLNATIFPYIHLRNLIMNVTGNVSPNEEAFNSVYGHHIRFIESTSESAIQLFLSCLILREFGIESNIRILSPILSIISLYVSFAKRHGFIFANDKKEPGFFSMDFVYGLIYWFIPCISILGLYGFYCFEKFSIFWPLCAIVIYMHPLTHFVLNYAMKKMKINKNSVLQVFSWLTLLDCLVLYCLRVRPISDNTEEENSPKLQITLKGSFSALTRVSDGDSTFNVCENSFDSEEHGKLISINVLEGESYLFLWFFGILPMMQCFLLESLPLFKCVSYDIFTFGPTLPEHIHEEEEIETDKNQQTRTSACCKFMKTLSWRFKTITVGVTMLSLSISLIYLWTYFSFFDSEFSILKFNDVKKFFLPIVVKELTLQVLFSSSCIILIFGGIFHDRRLLFPYLLIQMLVLGNLISWIRLFILPEFTVKSGVELTSSGNFTTTTVPTVPTVPANFSTVPKDIPTFNKCASFYCDDFTCRRRPGRCNYYTPPLLRSPIWVNASFAICDMNLNPLYDDPESQTKQDFQMELQEKICSTKLNPCKHGDICVVILSWRNYGTFYPKFSVSTKCFKQDECTVHSDCNQTSFCIERKCSDPLDIRDFYRCAPGYCRNGKCSQKPYGFTCECYDQPNEYEYDEDYDGNLSSAQFLDNIITSTLVMIIVHCSILTIMVISWLVIKSQYVDLEEIKQKLQKHQPNSFSNLTPGGGDGGSPHVF